MATVATAAFVLPAHASPHLLNVAVMGTVQLVRSAKWAPVYPRLQNVSAMQTVLEKKCVKMGNVLKHHPSVGPMRSATLVKYVSERNV